MFISQKRSYAKNAQTTFSICATNVLDRYEVVWPVVSLAPVPGPPSIAAGSVIVEVLVGWSPALPRHSPRPPKWPGVRADFLHGKKKKEKKKKKDMKWYVVIGAKGILRCSTKNVY